MLVSSNRMHTQEPPVTTALPRYLWAIVAALALTLTLATPAAAASSRTIIEVDDAAFEDGECAMRVGFDDQTEIVMRGIWSSRPSNSGNFTYTCKGEVEGAPPAQAIKISDPTILGPCRDVENQEARYTPTWSLHITPTGKATYSCQYKAN
jgi:hypothetical protein